MKLIKTIVLYFLGICLAFLFLLVNYINIVTQREGWGHSWFYNLISLCLFLVYLAFYLLILFWEKLKITKNLKRYFLPVTVLIPIITIVVTIGIYVYTDRNSVNDKNLESINLLLL